MARPPQREASGDPGAPSRAGEPAPDPGPLLRLNGLQKTFTRPDGTVVPAVNDISLSVQAGEMVVLLGPSGCGKTTLLRCIAGLERPDDGSIELGGTTVFARGQRVDVPPETRHIGMVFQSYALWPHLTVGQNVEFPLKMRGVGRREREQRSQRTLDLMEIGHLTDQFPGSLSGGQQQRVALARAIAPGDPLILFDEPLSNVDAKVRQHLRLSLSVLQREIGFTGIYVTHDQDEAMSLATQIAVLERGEVAQMGAPQEIYRAPATPYVGRFIGSTNEFTGVLRGGADGRYIETDLGRLPAGNPVSADDGAPVLVMSRPEQWTLSKDPVDSTHQWRGTVIAAAFVGPRNEYLVVVEGLELQVWDTRIEPLQVGDEVWCTVDPQALRVLVQGVDDQRPEGT